MLYLAGSKKLNKVLKFLCMNPVNLYRIYDAISFIYLIQKDDFKLLCENKHLLKVIKFNSTHLKKITKILLNYPTIFFFYD